MTEAQPPSHYDSSGRPRMVDVGAKNVSSRRAVAQGRISFSPQTAEAIRDGRVPKGNPFEIARIAGIQAAKQTADLIPLCHPLRITFVDLAIEVREQDRVAVVTATVAAEEKTGVEMEALVACATALLTIYDMLKALDPTMVIGPIEVIEKRGGKADYKK